MSLILYINGQKVLIDAFNGYPQSILRY